MLGLELGLLLEFYLQLKLDLGGFWNMFILLKIYELLSFFLINEGLSGIVVIEWESYVCQKCTDGHV